MADIELVIKISESRYKLLQTQARTNLGREKLDEFAEAVLNGTPLPKGHGDLVDYEELKNNAGEYGAYAEATLSHIKPKIIIEADKEND